MSLIDFVRVVELAKVFGLATLVVSCWMCVEIAHAEVWTAARLNRSGVNRPVGSRCTGDLLSGGGTGGFRAPDLPGFGIQGDWGLAPFDIRHSFVASGRSEETRVGPWR